jgi:hypothetical protein
MITGGAMAAPSPAPNTRRWRRRADDPAIIGTRWTSLDMSPPPTNKEKQKWTNRP